MRTKLLQILSSVFGDLHLSCDIHQDLNLGLFSHCVL